MIQVDNVPFVDQLNPNVFGIFFVFASDVELQCSIRKIMFKKGYSFFGKLSIHI